MQGVLKHQLNDSAKKSIKDFEEATYEPNRTDSHRLKSMVMRDESSVKNRVRLTECHDWSWSRKLWKKNSQTVIRMILINIAVYIALAYWATYYDGYRGVDNMYLITATLTTVGLGDVSPSKQSTKLLAVIMLPYGLIIFAFVMALTAAEVEAKLSQRPFEPHPSSGFSTHHIKRGASKSILNRGNYSSSSVSSISDNQPTSPNQDGSNQDIKFKLFGITLDVYGVKFTLLKGLLKYILVIIIGAVFFREYAPEDRVQHDHGVRMTWIDAFYFATVVATTVGYGHEIWAQTFGAKLFLCFYFLFATFIVGGILGHFSNLYLQMKEDEITEEIINDVTYVHNVDLHCNGKVNEAEFVLYKLMQLQQCDHELILRLSTKFSEYDSGDNGRVVIGLDVPNAEQVKEMKVEIANKKLLKKDSERDSTLLVELWEKKKKELISQAIQNDTSSTSLSSTNDDQHVMLKELDFSWSKTLWKKAAMETGRIVIVLCIIYFVGYYFLMSQSDFVESDPVLGWYFMAATISTVGFGDVAPESQIQRLVNIFFIPFGLIILGFIISFARVYTKSKPNKAQRVEDGSIRRIFETLNIPDNGYITKEQFIENHKLVSMSKQKAKDFFNKLDYNNDGKMYMPKTKYYFFETISGKFLIIFLKIYGTIFIGGIALKLWPSEENWTWIDVFYFGTVAATNIGYGDITPTTDSFRIFMIFYMLISTVIVGLSLGDALDIYLNDIMAEQVMSLLVQSSTYVHKADVDGTGTITEAEFIMFKLQQMEQVNKELLDRLSDHFEEIDFDDTRMLVIGLHIPNEYQANEMKTQMKQLGNNQSLIEIWKIKKHEIMLELGFDSDNKLIVEKFSPVSADSKSSTSTETNIDQLPKDTNNQQNINKKNLKNKQKIPLKKKGSSKKDAKHVTEMNTISSALKTDHGSKI